MTVQYPNLIFVLQSVPHPDSLQVPTPPLDSHLEVENEDKNPTNFKHSMTLILKKNMTNCRD